MEHRELELGAGSCSRAPEPVRSTAVWQYISMAVRQYGSTSVWQYGIMAVRQGLFGEGILMP